MIEYTKTEGGEWLRWANANIPSPPPRDALDGIRRCEEHAGCVDWRGVHFHAVRIDGRVWDAVNGWRCPYCTSDNAGVRETYFDQTCAGCVARMNPQSAQSGGKQVSKGPT